MSLVINDRYSGAHLIVAERERHHTEKGWTIDQDSTRYWKDELALAAACYASPNEMFHPGENTRGITFLRTWPWRTDWFKSNNRPDQSSEDRIRDLVKAGSLCAAEIDRLIYHEKILAVANKP